MVIYIHKANNNIFIIYISKYYTYIILKNFKYLVIIFLYFYGKLIIFISYTNIKVTNFI